MRTWLTLLSVGILSGCATNDPIDWPDWDIPKAAVEATEPLPLPQLPPLELEGNVATLDRAAVLALFAYREAAEANHDIAQANADALKAQALAYNQLIEAGKFQTQLMQIREEMLRQAKRDAFIDRMTLRGVVLLGIGLAL